MRNLLALSIFFLSFTVHAEDNTASWSQLFPGAPAPEILFSSHGGYYSTKLYPTLIAATKDCPANKLNGVSDKIWSEVKTYQKYLLNGRFREAEKVIHGTIDYVENDIGENNGCFHQAALSYILSSLVLWDQQTASNFNYELLLTTAFLGNQGKLVLLTPNLRKSLQGNDKKSFWTKKDSRGFEVIGGYECERSIIYIDSNLRPFNVSATLVHELDHLFRDKYEEVDETKTARLVTFVDELSATLHGLFVQKALATDPLILRSTYNRVDPEMHVTKKFLWYTRYDNTYQNKKQPPNDANLYAQNGFFDQFWDSRGMTPFSLYESFLKHWNITEGLTKNYPEYLPDLKILRSIMNVVSAGYFKNKSFIESTPVPTLSNPLSHAIWSVDEPFSGMDGFLFRLSSLTKKLDEPSNSCIAFGNSVTNGELDDYLGTGSSSDPGQPGNDGVRPSIPIKPCLRHVL